MRQKHRVKYLKKPKRIRKSKKEFLRGSRERVEPKVSYERTIIPLPYVLLFAFLAVTIIGYTSTNFLFGRIHVDATPLYSVVTSSLISIHLPHITLPSVTISLPKIPAVSLPSFNFSPLFTFLTQTTSVFFIESITYFNPFPFWIEVFSATVHFLAIAMTWIFINTMILILWAIKTAQTNGTSLAKSVHPLQLIQTGGTAIVTFALWMYQTTTSGTVWISGVLRDYLVLLGNSFSIAGIFLLHTAIAAETFLLQVLMFVMTKLIDITAQQLTLLQQILRTTLLSTATLLEIMQTFILNEIATVSLWIWEIINYASITIIDILHTVFILASHAVIVFFQGIVFVIASIVGFILHILTIIFELIVSVLMAIKKSIDNTIGAIGAFIHLGDPVYIVIASSINELFSSMGTTMSIMPKLLK